MPSPYYHIWTYNPRFYSHEAELDALSGDHQASQTQVKQLSQSNATLEASLAEFKNLKEDLERELSTTASLAESLGADKKRLEKETEELSSQGDLKAEMVKRLAEEAEILRALVAQREGEKQTQAERIQDDEFRRTESQQELAAAETAKETALQGIEGLKQASAELNTLQIGLQAADAARVAAEAKAVRAEEACTDALEQASASAELTDGLRQELAQVNQERAMERRDKDAAIQSVTAKWTGELSAVSLCRDQLKGELATLRTEREGLQIELVVQRQDLVRASHTHLTPI